MSLVLLLKMNKIQFLVLLIDSLNVVATDTESNTASTATPASLALSPNGIPNLSKSFLISGSTSSHDLGPTLGAE